MPFSPRIRFFQWCLEPLSWTHHLMTGAATALSLWAMAPPGAYVGVLLIGILLWLVVGFIWSVRILVRLVVATVHNQSLIALLGGWKPWLVCPLLCLSTALLIYWEVPFPVAFALSRPAMEQLARQAQTTHSSTSQPPQWVGLYWTQGYEAKPWGVKIYLGSGLLESHGFAYSSQGQPATETSDNLGCDTYTPLTRNWYMWEHTEDW